MGQNIPSSVFQLSSSEEEKIKHLSQLDQEKYRAKKHEEFRARLDSECIKKINEENKSMLSVSLNKSKVNTTTVSQTINREQFVFDRELLIKGCFRSNFSLIKNGFVRVKINNKYRICKILDIVEIASYKIPLKYHKEEYCNVGLNLDAGERKLMKWPLINISGNPITTLEFHEFLKNYQITQVVFDNICEKFKIAYQEFNRNLTNNEITDYLLLKSKANPKKLSGTFLKMELIKERDDAIQRQDKIAAEKAQKALEELEDQEYKEQLENINKKNKSKIDKDK
ncbi:transcription factor [Enterocytozoon bieneusi H348]|nr:transcription factor [Enterocytozoon bieneusi H348]|eukprot:XP_002649479.1 transcription factor [Enterocytozoon bieneusi H348]